MTVRSVKVIVINTEWSATGNHGSISYRFRDTTCDLVKSEKFSNHVYLMHPQKELCDVIWAQKNWNRCTRR